MENMNNQDAIKWLELFKYIVRKESETALSVNHLASNLEYTLTTLINKCK